MFKIFVLAMSIATGNPVGMFTSQETYATKEACDAVRTARIEDFKVWINLQVQVQGGVDVQSKCDVEGTPS